MNDQPWFPHRREENAKISPKMSTISQASQHFSAVSRDAANVPELCGTTALRMSNGGEFPSASSLSFQIRDDIPRAPTSVWAFIRSRLLFPASTASNASPLASPQSPDSPLQLPHLRRRCHRYRTVTDRASPEPLQLFLSWLVERR